MEKVKHYKTIFQVKRGTLINWITQNPILRAGEPSYVLDTGEFRIGNGIDVWTNLPSIVGVTEERVRELIQEGLNTYAPQIPVATLTKLGLVKSSSDNNKISVNEDGEMEVNSLDLNRVYQEAEDVLILDCT